MTSLDRSLVDWLDGVAGPLDDGRPGPVDVVSRLGADRLFGIGVAEASGGAGGGIADALEAIAAVSARSLAAGFLFWSQRTFIEYLLQSSNEALSGRLLPDLLAGRTAGATGLSNAMKALAGIEALQIEARESGSVLRLDGRMPWVTNLDPRGFHVAAVAKPAGGGEPVVVSLAHDLSGLTRSADLDLIGLRGTHTAAIALDGIEVGQHAVLSRDGTAWCFRVRPAFLALQCGLSIGVARRCFAQARAKLGPTRSVIGPELAGGERALGEAVDALKDGIRGGVFAAHAAPLFRLRIRFAELAAEAVALELQTGGGKAYVKGTGEGFERRWRESAFLPLITPSVVQLRGALAAQAQTAEVA